MTVYEYLTVLSMARLYMNPLEYSISIWLFPVRLPSSLPLWIMRFMRVFMGRQLLDMPNIVNRNVAIN